MSLNLLLRSPSRGGRTECTSYELEGSRDAAVSERDLLGPTAHGHSRRPGGAGYVGVGGAADLPAGADRLGRYARAGRVAAGRGCRAASRGRADAAGDGNGEGKAHRAALAR